MRERITARVLLFDPGGRVLLMKGRLPHAPDAPGEWFTVGGGVEPGESVLQAAAREIVEETGFSGVELGRVVWLREVEAVTRRGDMVLVKETYLTARCLGGEPCRDGWDARERSLIDDIRWWSPDEIEAADETFHPQGAARLLAELIAGEPPEVPLVLPRLTRR